MRDILSTFLSDKASQNKNFYVFSGDHGYALFDEIRKKAPSQFINTGVTEQAMIGCAAGMAKQGKRVVVYGLASFIPIRVLEFIKMNICYPQLPVIILGDGAGLVYSTLGASHQCSEDVAALRAFPIKIYSPADQQEMKLCLEDAYTQKGPCYIRIGKSDRPAVNAIQSGAVGLASIKKITNHHSELALFSTGSMVSATKELAEKYSLSAYSCPILNEFNKVEFLECIKLHKKILSIEEHSVAGGLASIIADLISEEGLSIKLSRKGINHKYTKKCGSYDFALKYHELDLESLNERVLSLL